MRAWGARGRHCTVELRVSNVSTRAATTCPHRGGGRLRFGNPSATFVHIIQHNIDQDICRIFNTGTFERQRAQLIGKTIPAKELSEIDTTDFESLQVLENIEGNS
jgi:hypothetical protein